MGFKLGTSRTPFADRGEIKRKLMFKKDRSSIPGNPIKRVPLAEGVVAEANGPNHHKDPNTIYLNETVDPNSNLAKQAIKHEMIHMTAMKISPNKLSYTDNSVTYEGRVYPRKDINGKDMIMDVDTGNWKEAGDNTWPWEVDANMLMIKNKK